MGKAKARVLCENKHTPVHLHPMNYGDDRGPKGIRSKTPIVPRVREPGEAGPMMSSIWTAGSYRTGDGEPTAQPQRPGSGKAYTLPSLGGKSW